MIETATIKPAKTGSTNPVQADRNESSQSSRSQQFKNSSGKNPCHEGGNVSEKQLQTNRGETQAVSDTNNTAEQSSGVDKASGNNCPGSNIIANLLQELIQTLEAIQTGR